MILHNTMSLGTLLLAMMKTSNKNTASLDLDGIEITFCKKGDDIKPVRVEYSREYIAQMLQAKTAELLGLKRPESILVGEQIANQENGQLVSMTAVPSDKAE